MEAKDFIYEELNEFIKRFPKTRIRYEYDKNALVHVVEVLPNEVYHLDSDYIQWEDDLYNRFVSQFPLENICFISDDAIVGIDSPELMMEGLEYAPITCVWETKNILNTKIVKTLNDCFEMPFPAEMEEYKIDFVEGASPYIESEILIAA
jgi:hypothetical protein